MNKKEAYALGYERGKDVASWQDMPEVGDTLPRHIDWMGLPHLLVTRDDRLEAWSMLCNEAESHGRDFSPWEHTAHAINTSRDPEGYWETYDQGITDGISAYRRKHYPLRGKW